MPMRLRATASLFAGTLVAAGMAHGAGLKPFARDDEWTFVQTRTEPGHAATSHTIRFGTPLRKANGDAVLAWAKAVMADGQVVWQPIGTLPPTQCLRDFVGRSDLGLANSCGNGLRLGAQWQASSVMPGDEELLDLVALREEEIRVGAGTFRAVRIEGKGQRRFSDRPPETLTVTYWFAPQAKAMVRTVREYRGTSGALTIRIVEEMTAYKVN